MIPHTQNIDAAVHSLMGNPKNCAQVIKTRDHANHLFQQSKFKEALKLNLPLAKCGDARAQLEVGFMYEFGQGTKTNYQNAALWYYSAIKPNAYNAKPLERGLNYYFGLNDHTKNIATATQWFRMAAELSVDRY